MIEGNDLTALAEWHSIAEQLRLLKAREIKLRKELFNSFFPEPVEGTNNFELPQDWVLKGKYSVSRKIDEAMFDAHRESLEKDSGIAVDSLISYKLELNLSAFKKLDEKKQLIFSEILIVKESTPTLDIILPAENSTVEE